MRYLAIAFDYDGTLAHGGKVEEKTVQALELVKFSGRRTLLVTGRLLEDLKNTFPRLDLFDLVVVENGAILYYPTSQKIELMAAPFPERFVARLRELEVRPLNVGRIIVSTITSEKEKLLNVIQELGMEAQIIFNGDSVMVLPAGINKATGAEHALRKMGLSFHEVVGIGDSENDHSLLKACECPIAVNNAIDSIKQDAAYITQGSTGDGIVELVEHLIESDLDFLAPRLSHNHIELGKRIDRSSVSGSSISGSPVWIPAYGHNLLIAGPSGSGKSTFATGFIERLLLKDYQICIIDPEGDYGTLSDVVPIGSPKRTPSTNEILGILEDSKINISVNLLGVPLADRPEFLAELLPSLQSMRARTGRPHWIVIDEAHHVLPNAWGAASLVLPQKLGETILLTVHPGQVAPSILRLVDTVVAVGPHPNKTLGEFSEAAGKPYSGPLSLPERKEEVVAWLLHSGQEPFTLEVIPGQGERLRHLRKYAEGNLGNHSFYFRGPDKTLNLKAQNLAIFSQISDGLDEKTWGYHFKQGDYSKWFRTKIKDPHLAEETKRIEQRKDLKISEARELICQLIRARYTL